MLLKPWSYPSLLRWKQMIWVGFGVFVVGLAFWYEKNVASLSWYALLVWGILLAIGSWEVFTTPLWTVDPSCKRVSRQRLFQFVSWSFEDVRFVFSPLLHKTWEGKPRVAYFFGIEENHVFWKVGVLSEKEYIFLQEIAKQFHIPVEVRDEAS